MLRYTDIATGEIVAYELQKGIFKVLVSESKAQELVSSKYDLMVDLHDEECLVRRGYLYRLSSAVYELDFEPDTLSDEQVWIDGYVFEKDSGIEIDNDFAIKRYVRGEDVYG